MVVSSVASPVACALANGAAMKSFWTPARDKRLLAEWENGRSAAEIAKLLGTSRNAVIGRSGRRMTARAFWTPLRDNQLLTGWGRSRSVAAIAKKLGTTTTAVTARMTRLRELAERPGADPWQRAAVRRAVATRKRSSGQLDDQRKAFAALDKAIASGVPRGKAIAQCYRAGAASGVTSGITSRIASRTTS